MQTTLFHGETANGQADTSAVRRLRVAPSEAPAVAEELTKLRLRGIDEIDVAKGQHKKRLDLPLLDVLARRYLGPRMRTSHPSRIRQFLDAGLSAYQQAGNEQEATFIRHCSSPRMAAVRAAVGRGSC